MKKLFVIYVEDLNGNELERKYYKQETRIKSYCNKMYNKYGDVKCAVYSVIPTFELIETWG